MENLKIYIFKRILLLII